MKKILRIPLVVIVAIFFSGCVKNLEDEGISIDNVTHFSYGGYTYQVHPDLGLMNWNHASSACNSLVAYGYDDWFLPSMGEMKAAREAGLTWVKGWTSSFYYRYYSDTWYYCYDDDEGFHDELTIYDLSVFPMRKQ